VSKLNDTNGVRLQPTQVGNIALLISIDYLDTPMFPAGRNVPDMALILSRDDARILGAQLISYARSAT
jgi:hypothetical protein